MDVDNNKYLDYVMGCQPLLLGYADKDVNNAVVSQLKGSTFSLHNELEVDVAKLLKANIPSAEMSRFGKMELTQQLSALELQELIQKEIILHFAGIMVGMIGS